MSFLKAVRDHYGDPDPPHPTPHTTPPGPTAGPGGEDTPYGIAALTSECEHVANAPEGTRNDTLNRAAFRMGRLIATGQLTEQTAHTNLAAAAAQAGLDPREIDATIRSGLPNGTRHPRQPAPRPTVVAGATKTTPDHRQDTHQPDDDAFWNARPELHHIQAFARARRACPWAVLGVVLARITTATPPWVVLPALVGAQASLNLYIALVAPSGGGKGASEACAADAIHLGTAIDTAGVGSGEGIAHLFARRTKAGVETIRDAVLMRVAEIDTLAALGDRKGATLLPELRKAWSGEDLGFAYADPTKALPIKAHTYRLSLVAGVQPGRAQWVLDDADGGTPQRFLWMPAVDPHAPDQPPPCPQPLDWTAHRWGASDPLGRVAMGVCETARHIIDTNRLARLRGDGDALDGHALLARLKAAAALALLNGRGDITDDDWDLSATIADISERTRQGVLDTLKTAAKVANQTKAEAEAARTIVVTERVAEDGIKRACRSILRQLDKLGEKAYSNTRTDMSSRDRQYFEEAVVRLEQADQIEVEDAHAGGRKLVLKRPAK